MRARIYRIYVLRSSADYRNKVALLTNIIARYYSVLSWIKILKSNIKDLNLYIAEGISRFGKKSLIFLVLLEYNILFQTHAFQFFND